MDAAGAVDAQNAPTAPWKTAQHAVPHSAHTRHRYSRGNKEQKPTPSTRPTHKIPDTPACPLFRSEPPAWQPSLLLSRLPAMPTPCTVHLYSMTRTRLSRIGQ